MLQHGGLCCACHVMLMMTMMIMTTRAWARTFGTREAAHSTTPQPALPSSTQHRYLAVNAPWPNQGGVQGLNAVCRHDDLPQCQVGCEHTKGKREKEKEEEGQRRNEERIRRIMSYGAATGARCVSHALIAHRQYPLGPPAACKPRSCRSKPRRLVRV